MFPKSYGHITFVLFGDEPPGVCRVSYWFQINLLLCEADQLIIEAHAARLKSVATTHVHREFDTLGDMENHSNPPPPAMHPAMLMAAANPFVAYALGNQFIPHTQASVMQGAALIGPHGYFQGFPRLEGIPGYPAIVASSGTQPVHESIDHGAESSETWSTNPTSSNQERRGRDDERYKYDDRT
ncbi:unnamed protein product [Notodromas monacha]|uniref:Uncharacterized protein n=1 Tax=Notodromas monacha TaxID=399045 RepID=A0A7R9BFW2_9CRUS|nr:unnamed protein product [Notodromas monacha]CAG0914696.1 unnamed protein product [Notodromas monacha]